MKYTTMILVAIVLLSVSFASMTKMYIGSENDQVIVGIESLAANVDGGAGMEIRTYFRKNGIMVNDEEYGALEGKTKYILTAAGKSEAGSIIKLQREIVYAFNPEIQAFDFSGKNIIQTGYGKGTGVLYQ
jgi:hypothetical protein